MLPMRKLRRRRRRLVPRPRPGPSINSDLRAALQRVRRRRAEMRAAGQEPPSPEPRATELRKRARAVGLLGRRRRIPFRVKLPVDLVEHVLWSSGARTIQELVELAVAKLILGEMAQVTGGSGGAAAFRASARRCRLATRSLSIGRPTSVR
jgi:hypothetical protein